MANQTIPDDNGSEPRTVAVFMPGKTDIYVGAEDALDAARQLAITVLKLDDGLPFGTTIQVNRV
jgi:hypothetical protein